MTDWKSVAGMKITVNGRERPMTPTERRFASVLLFPMIARHVAREMRKRYPEADAAAIAERMRAEAGPDPAPEALKLIERVVARLPPPVGAAARAAGSPWGSPSAWVLILANVVPVWGVLFLDWAVFPLMLLFWLENVVVGVLNVARMLLVDPTDVAGWVAKLFMVPFFCAHYGMFTGIHGMFVFTLFGGDDFANVGDPGETIAAAVSVMVQAPLGIAFLALAVSHLFSFAFNYVLRGEYRSTALGELMGKPYGRVVVLHLVIIFAGFAVMALDSPVWALLLLVALKIGLDVKAHLREHRSFAARAKG